MNFKFSFNFDDFDFNLFRKKLLSCNFELNVIYFLHIFLYDQNNISGIIPFKFDKVEDFDLVLRDLFYKVESKISFRDFDSLHNIEGGSFTVVIKKSLF